MKFWRVKIKANCKTQVKIGWHIGIDVRIFYEWQAGPIVFIDETVKQDLYIDILRESFTLFIEVLATDSLTNLIFQQDNVSPHKARRTIKWLKDLATTHRFSIMNWPSNLLDLNPIENLWAHMKLELHRKYLDTAFLEGSSQAIKTVLHQRLYEV